jgi:23S rRNA (uracil1939-C5)-methyltransferase
VTKSKFPTPNSTKLANPCQQGQLIEIEITDLTDTGDGVGRFGELVVFVPDTVTGDRVLVRLVQVKSTYATGKLDTLLETSEHRIRANCIVADKCGGCQWQHVDYQYQLAAKQNQIIQALERIGGFSNPQVDEILTGKIEGFSQFLGYRNKATYPWQYLQQVKSKQVTIKKAPTN